MRGIFLVVILCVAGLSAEARTIAYDVRFEGAPEAMRAALRDASSLVSLEEAEGTLPAGLVRRAGVDIDRLGAVLRSFGHYDGRIAILFDGRAHDQVGITRHLAGFEGRLPITIKVTPGPQYRIGAVTLEIAGDGPARAEYDLPIAVGDPALAASVIEAGAQALARTRALGHPFAAGSREVTIDRAARTMAVTYRIDPGPLTHLGAITISGLDRTDADYVRSRLAISEGERYSPAALDRSRSALTGTGLFASVSVQPARERDATGALPVAIELTERKPRSIGFGAALETSRGAELSAFWEHRNLLGRAENLRVEASIDRLLAQEITDISSRLGATFRKPDFRRAGQTLSADTALTREVTDRFTQIGLESGVALERPLFEKVVGALGVSLDLSRIREDLGARAQSRTFALLSLPASLRRDSSDDVLNPTTGSRLSVSAEPTLGLLDGALGAAKIGAEARLYRALDADRRIIAAGRLKLGAILLADTADIAADRRFFAGGGGSVRGYEFETIGPLDIDDNPIGGRSLLEGSVELRWRVWNNIGLVPFIDAGGVFDDAVPGFDEDVRIGAGLGVRYHTDFGPLRLDLATPINPRDRDPAFQLYLSIGQAF